jgi:hypothetical protein
MSETVNVLRTDVADVIAELAAYFGHQEVAVDAVVSEIDAALHLVGRHPLTTMLSPSTVRIWIAGRLAADFGRTKFEEILANNTP